LPAPQTRPPVIHLPDRLPSFPPPARRRDASSLTAAGSHRPQEGQGRPHPRAQLPVRGRPRRGRLRR
jgi:hypothetical protein